MPKKSRRTKGRSHKWSRANIMNYVAGGIVAFSMILGSIFVFGGASSTPSSAQTNPTPIVTKTTVPVLGAGLTPTPSSTPGQ